MSLIGKMLKTLNSAKSSGGIRSFSTKKRTYEDAIIALNSLQTNAVTLSKSIHLKQHQKHDEANINLRDTEKYLERVDDGLLKSLENLSFIHVSGSKGKGSVCTYTDAILREFNVKTGLFTSPHLISVTERIKLRGSSITQNQFSKYFWEVYDALNKKKTHESDLPSYFKFLQIMAFYIFVKEKVDVAIVEVGIGGQFDSTNILKNTEIVGITALQLEHTQLLGNTLKEIAWQKAGIIKENSHVFYMPQPSECINVIKERFNELKGKSLSRAPALTDYKWVDCVSPDFTASSEVKALNFSLSTQLSACWLKNRNLISKDLFIGDAMMAVDDKFTNAFNKCQFNGRFEVINGGNDITYFLDGAHTKDSMQICADWFSKQLENNKEDKKNDCINILIFNVTGDRDSELIMKQLHSIRFDYVCFTTNILNSDAYNEQSENFTGVLSTTQFDRCINHKEIWIKLLNQQMTSTQTVMCHPTIKAAIDFMLSIRENNESMHINVLFTGSLHLVGGALKLINSTFSSRKIKTRSTGKTKDEVVQDIKIKKLRTM